MCTPDFICIVSLSFIEPMPKVSVIHVIRFGHSILVLCQQTIALILLAQVYTLLL